MKRFFKQILCIALALTVVLSGFTGVDYTAQARAESQRDAIVRIALAEEGVSGCPNKYTYAFGEIDGSYDWGWCGAFVYWCSQQAGIPHSIIKRNAKSDVNSFNTPYYTYSAYADVKKGDILYMLNNNGRHIGLVTDVDDEYIYTIEGNVSNTVTRYRYNRSDGYADWSHDSAWQKITHYGVPAYEDIKEEPTKEIKPADSIYKITSSYREEGRTDYDYLNFSKDDSNIHVRTNLDGLRDSERVRCQYFNITHIADGWFTITNIGTGKAMEVKDGGTAPGTNIQQGALTKKDSQLFKFYDAGDGLVYIKSKLGCYVDIQSETYTVNDNVWTYKFNGSPTQKWKLHSHIHESTSQVTKEATCSEKGIMTCYCSVCRLTYMEEIPLKDHTYGRWTVVKKATCMTEGEEKRSCSVCNTAETRKTDLSDHTFSNGVCSVCGISDGKKIMTGDIDKDTRITASDARLALRNSVGLERFDAELNRRADIDKDGKVTAGDARMILRASVGLEDPGKWK